ncbi:methyltransferase domain-containing protein [Maribacter sp.]|uniref:methyltransferase domain-containing protein n=1 Tax=Maribacter sp. TaxID=1897614 RepID=UPI0025C0A9D2|nr:methyltransferase domain-containing protein [Maribacter sp.]
METLRKPNQGVLNIVRFNWHFYVIAILLIGVLLLGVNYVTPIGQMYIYSAIIILLVAVPLLVSLVVSWYVYDCSGLYAFSWLPEENTEQTIVNVNAGFDETSAIFKQRFKNSELKVFDFYDPKKHTEVSIQRARKAYPPYKNTIIIETTQLPMEDSTADKILVVFAAHEIRDVEERQDFFKELYRVLKPNGRIYVQEHLRDTANFLGYTVGFLHFYDRKSWFTIFKNVNLDIAKELKQTPFVTTFILEKNGNTH